MFRIDDVQQLKMGVVPVRNLTGQVEDILAPIDEICDKQKRVSATVARTEVLVLVDLHADFLPMELGG